jgi:ligand-binding sensor domain-containing protein/DNA-binding CsgD family transcriptional regulator
LLVSVSLAGQSNSVYFERIIPSSNGNSLPVIHCISQDSKGFIWITSPYGLARYDGNEFLIFQHQEKDPTSIIDNYLFSVLEDSKGNLWITSDKGLELLDRKTGDFIHFQHDPGDPNSLPSNDLRSIAEDNDGCLWLGTLDAGVCQFDYETKTFKRFTHDPSDPNSPSSNSVWAICCDHKGKIWLGTHEGLFDCYDKTNEQWTHFNLLPYDRYLAGDPNVWDLCEGQNGKIWIGTSSLGLIGFDPDSGSFDRISLKENKGNGGGDYKILSLLQDREGIIWVGTDKAGVFSYDPANNSLQRFTVNTMEPGSLSDNSVISIFEDREGLLWFGTGKGISLLNKKRFRFPLVQFDAQSPEKLSDNNIIAIYEDREEVVWISTALGGLNIWDKKTDMWNQWNIPQEKLESFRRYPIQAICEDSLGKIWLGNSRGLHVYERQNNSMTQIRNSQEDRVVPSRFDIMTMAQGHNDSIWVGTNIGELFRWDAINREAHLYPNPQQKVYKAWYKINTIFVDGTGGVWIGTQWHGVSYLDPQDNHWIHYLYDAGDPDSLPSPTVYSIAEDNTGRIWAGTEAGPCYLDSNEQKWRNLAKEIQLPDNSAYGLLFDKSDGIWMSTNTGLIQIDPASLRWRIYGPEDGLQNLIFNPGVCFKSQNGEMYFGGISGFNYFYPDMVHVNALPPPVVITSFQTAVQEKQTNLLEGMSSLKVTKKDLPITIKMAALSYAFPQKNHYSVKTLDRERSEIYYGTRNSFYLRDLKRGKNRFLIQASNHDLTWNDAGVELTVDLATPLIPPWILVLFISISTSGAAWLIYNHRHRKRTGESADYVQIDIPALAAGFNLTKREQEIIVLVLAGKTNKDIEKELFISLKTVKTHLYNIYRKLRVQNRLQLMNAVKDYLNKNRSLQK